MGQPQQVLPRQVHLRQVPPQQVQPPQVQLQQVPPQQAQLLPRPGLRWQRMSQVLIQVQWVLQQVPVHQRLALVQQPQLQNGSIVSTRAASVSTVLPKLLNQGNYTQICRFLWTPYAAHRFACIF